MQRPTLLALIALFALFMGLTAGCASTAPRAATAHTTPSSAAIAHELADAAALRANPSHMRVLVHLRVEDDALTGVAAELERELVTSLAGRFHLFDSELPSGAAPEDLDARVERLDVTHALVGDTALRGSDVVLSLRLVEHESRHIVASAQGSVPLSELNDASRLALARPGAPAVIQDGGATSAAEPGETESIDGESTGDAESLVADAGTTDAERGPLDEARARQSAPKTADAAPSQEKERAPTTPSEPGERAAVARVEPTPLGSASPAPTRSVTPAPTRSVTPTPTRPTGPAAFWRRKQAPPSSPPAEPTPAPESERDSP